MMYNVNAVDDRPLSPENELVSLGSSYTRVIVEYDTEEMVQEAFMELPENKAFKELQTVMIVYWPCYPARSHEFRLKKVHYA